MFDPGASAGFCPTGGVGAFPTGAAVDFGVHEGTMAQTVQPMTWVGTVGTNGDAAGALSVDGVRIWVCP